MAGELHDNAEAKAFTPAGAESSRLVVSNGEMAAFQGVQQHGNVADREQAMFSNGFDFNQAGNIYSSKDTVAWDPRQTYGDARQGGLRTDVVRVMGSGAVERGLFPYRGFEDQKLADCAKDNPQAWNQAFESYPKLQQYLSAQDGTQLMKALVRNELHFYDAKDALGDRNTKAGKTNEAETLGYAQITPKGIKEFETGILNGQQVREPDKQLTDFLEKKGYAGPGHEAKALEDPSCVPMIVASKLNTLIQAYEKSGTAINARTLAYGYNADVYYNPNKPDSFHAASYPMAESIERKLGNVKAFPTDSEAALRQSTHVQNVESQMKYVR